MEQLKGWDRNKLVHGNPKIQNAGPPLNTLNLRTITSNIAILLMIITIGGKLQSALKGLGPQNWQPHWVFAFLIAVTEVNVINIWISVFKNPDIETLAFRKKVSEELINNPYWFEESAQEACRERLSGSGIGHSLIALPPNCRFQGTQIVPSDIRYPQRKCTVYWRKCRDYCSCSPETIICHCCLPNHRIEMGMEMQEANWTQHPGFQPFQGPFLLLENKTLHRQHVYHTKA